MKFIIFVVAIFTLIALTGFPIWAVSLEILSGVDQIIAALLVE